MPGSASGHHVRTVNVLLVYGLFFLAIILISHVAVALRPRPRTRPRDEGPTFPGRPRRRLMGPVRRPTPRVDAVNMRRILRERLGHVWEAEEQRIRARILLREQEIEARLHHEILPSDLPLLVSLHGAAEEAATNAHRQVAEAWRQADRLAAGVREALKLLDDAADRATAAALRATLDVLQHDRSVVEAFTWRYYADVGRLNSRRRELRETIARCCGVPGRAWAAAREAEAQRSFARAPILAPPGG
jgi:hypothetical protein